MRHSISGCNFCAKLTWNRTKPVSNSAPPCFIPFSSAFTPKTKSKCNSKLWRYVSICNESRTNQRCNKKKSIFTIPSISLRQYHLLIEKIFKFLLPICSLNSHLLITLSDFLTALQNQDRSRDITSSV